MTLTDLAVAARKSGLTVIELDNWEKNGRPKSTGGFAPVPNGGVLVHHTGAYDKVGDTADDLSYARWLAFTGRPGEGIPAPLAHLALSAEGVVYILAAGRANHAGKAKASGPVKAGDGNALYIGIEAMNDGKQGWASKGVDASGAPITQGDAYVRLVAALCLHYGFAADRVRAHRETSTTGKWDPGKMDMAEFRAAVAAAMKGDAPKPSRPSTPPKKQTSHRVVAGDTLSSIASKYGVSVANLAAWNRLENPDLIYAGQTLLLTAPTSTPAPSKPRVSLAAVIRAARADTARPQGGTTPGAAASVRLVEQALVAERLLAPKWANDGSFGSLTVKAYSAWQKRCGYKGSDADGIPGRASLVRLGQRHGFSVTS